MERKLKKNNPKKLENPNIFLAGFMGSGKTTVGEILSKKLNKKFFDLDQEIEKFLGKYIFDVIEKFGIEYFRKIENQQLALLCQHRDAVIALGGGSLILDKNQMLVKKSGKLVYLMVEEKTLIRRLEKSYLRPLLKSGKGLGDLFEERKSGYMKADLCIRTDDFTPESVSNMILNEIKEL